ncbi:GNAT family N-acetyltransferase [Streptomyces flavofungini]|uniref:GNAT family N-acetyltransferase n=1 Tax=Streptomyces flavofungini TaxID=68200 RepID=UPI0025B267C4|nr:GNAT family N-acetyltransferase [Streptomyces flavofungini]WJV47460.1 GNAT family N-acetyltransferase [Streptomyces flavofungini]
MTSPAPLITRATAHDVAELRQLYFAVYGSDYRIKLGTCPKTMADTIADPAVTWLVARLPGSGQVIASALLRRDPAARIGRLEGVAVHPDHRVAGLAARMLDRLCAEALGPAGELDSVYAAARTATRGPQRMLLRTGFRPMGVLPNATLFRRREHIALMVRHRDGVLARRAAPPRLSAEVRPLAQAAERAAGIGVSPAVPTAMPAPPPAPPRERQVEFERIEAADFVRRRHQELQGARGNVFYPFHQPNTMLTPVGGGFEVYAALDPALLTCALVDITPDVLLTASLLEQIVESVEAAGARYVEALLPLRDQDALRAFHAQGFVPSALYPAMRRVGDSFEDYVVVSRAPHHLDFRTADIDPSLRPYIDHYCTAWTSTYLTTTDRKESA